MGLVGSGLRVRHQGRVERLRSLPVLRGGVVEEVDVEGVVEEVDVVGVVSVVCISSEVVAVPGCTVVFGGLQKSPENGVKHLTYIIYKQNHFSHSDLIHVIKIEE